MDRRLLRFLLQMSAPLLLLSCASPSSSPQSLRRLEPAELAAIEAARAAPLSLDDIVRRSRAGTDAATLIGEIRRSGTRHALTPADAQRLRGQGVAQEVLDELADAQARWARDEATAAKVRRDTAQAAAEDRARAEAERRQRARSTYYPPYYDPLWPYGYPGRAGYGGFGWGFGIRH